MTDHAPGSSKARWLHRAPFGATAVASLLTVIVLLPIWVLAATVLGAIGLVRGAKPQSPAAAERTEAILWLALGCSVGPIVYLLLAAVVAVTG